MFETGVVQSDQPTRWLLVYPSRLSACHALEKLAPQADCAPTNDWNCTPTAPVLILLDSAMSL